MIFEKIKHPITGIEQEQIKSSFIIITSFLSFIGGIVLLFIYYNNYEKEILYMTLGILLILASPFIFLYPIVRFFLARGSSGNNAATIAVKHFLVILLGKWIISKIMGNDSNKKK